MGVENNRLANALVQKYWREKIGLCPKIPAGWVLLGEKQ